jgi:PTH1 family peptidyl-tRNA hydrolase
MFGEALERMHGPATWQEKFHGVWGKVHIEGETVMMLKPMTYVNESGRSVGAMARFFSIDPPEILVVHDDLELPFLTAKMQLGGGLGGHNGLRSIKDHLGTSDFPRLRIGIGRPARQDVASFVLSRFDQLEEPLLPQLFETALAMLSTVMREGSSPAVLPMTRVVGELTPDTRGKRPR